MPYASGCRGCGSPCDGNRCAACNSKRREEEAARRAYRREHGLCLTCGDPVAKTKIAGGAAGKRVRAPAAYCAQHLAYYAARRATLRLRVRKAHAGGRIRAALELAGHRVDHDLGHHAGDTQPIHGPTPTT